MSVSAFRRSVPVDFGVLKCDVQGYLQDFQEKPILNFDVSMGIYCLHKSVIQDLPAGEPYGFDRLMRDSLACGRKVMIHTFQGFWLDIGRPDDYEAANENFTTIAGKLGLPL